MIKFETRGREGYSLKMSGGAIELLAELGSVCIAALNNMADSEKEFTKLKDMLVSALVVNAEYLPKNKEENNGNE